MPLYNHIISSSDLSNKIPINYTLEVFSVHNKRCTQHRELHIIFYNNIVDLF